MLIVYALGVVTLAWEDVARAIVVDPLAIWIADFKIFLLSQSQSELAQIRICWEVIERRQ